MDKREGGNAGMPETACVKCAIGGLGTDSSASPQNDNWLSSVVVDEK